VLSDPETRAPLRPLRAGLPAKSGGLRTRGWPRVGVRRSAGSGRGPRCGSTAGDEDFAGAGFSGSDFSGAGFGGGAVGLRRTCSRDVSATAARSGSRARGPDGGNSLLDRRGAYRGGRRKITSAAAAPAASATTRSTSPRRVDGQRHPAGRPGAGAGTATPPRAISTSSSGSRRTPRYRLSGRDVTVDLPVSPWERPWGATVPVTTPGGAAKVRRPAGLLKRPQAAAARRGHAQTRGRTGHLYAEIRIMVPPRSTERDANCRTARRGLVVRTRGGGT